MNNKIKGGKRNKIQAFIAGLLGMIFLAMTIGCSSDSEQNSSDDVAKHLRITRSHIINALAESGVLYRQKGQMIRLVIPTPVLFLNHSSVLRSNNRNVSMLMNNLIGTYDVEKVNVVVISEKKILNRFDLALSTKRAEKVQGLLKDMGLSVPLMMSKGVLNKKDFSSYGMNFSDYIEVDFKFFKR